MTEQTFAQNISDHFKWAISEKFFFKIIAMENFLGAQNNISGSLKVVGNGMLQKRTHRLPINLP